MFAEKDSRVREFFYTFFRTIQSSISLINGSQFLRTALKSARQGAVATLEMTIPYAFGAHNFFTEKR